MKFPEQRSPILLYPFVTKAFYPHPVSSKKNIIVLSSLSSINFEMKKSF